jgi:hippurate hydrolase
LSRFAAEGDQGSTKVTTLTGQDHDATVEMPSPSMGSEDFAWFAERVPSAHLRIGSKIDGHDTAIHRADYQLNEQMIPLAMKVMTRAVLGLMP